MLQPRVDSTAADSIKGGNGRRLPPLGSVFFKFQALAASHGAAIAVVVNYATNLLVYHQPAL